MSHPPHFRSAKKKSQVRSFEELRNLDEDIINESLFQFCEEKNDIINSYWTLVSLRNQALFGQSEIMVQLYYPYHFTEFFLDDPNYYVIERENRSKLIEIDNFVVKDLEFNELVVHEGGDTGFPNYFVKKRFDLFEVPKVIRSIEEMSIELLKNKWSGYVEIETDKICRKCLFEAQHNHVHERDFDYCPSCGEKLYEIIPSYLSLNTYQIIDSKKVSSPFREHFNDIELLNKAVKKAMKMENIEERIVYLRKVFNYKTK